MKRIGSSTGWEGLEGAGCQGSSRVSILGGGFSGGELEEGVRCFMVENGGWECGKSQDWS